ncbi:MAG: tRNA (adenosine(37)-N6)-threonylcarbamoyltransferase complex dimerization subunit type 1 TsaB [Minwuia thermotolerans]|nr:MAG: tRNA (adenosine(37)-N6)-threonylcarbamoyltransferase complex dimerization subunit type 1 TsaB [Minwuia thermotolerans]
MILAIDTASRALSIALGDGRGVSFAAHQLRSRGQAENLMPMIERGFRATGSTAADLTGLAVTVGPGTFTGLRIGLAAARAMRVALNIPLLGMTALEVLAADAARRFPDRPVLAALDARRDQVYAQMFRRAEPPFAECWSAPVAVAAEGAALMAVSGTVLIGNGAALVASHVAGQTVVLNGVEPDARHLLRLAAARSLPSCPVPAPGPLYLRAPDAKLPTRR